MSPLPKINFVPAPEWQRQRLQRWLRLRELDERPIGDLGETTSGDSVSEIASGEILSRVRQFDPVVEIGDIRLLPPLLAPEGEAVPRYLAVLRNWDDEGGMLVAPFSKYSEPATTGELATGRSHFSLANLELWNARIISPLALKRTWRADKMTDAETADALAALSHVTAGTPLPAALAQRVGPPIVQPDDPRIPYQDEETAAMNPLEHRSALIEDFLDFLVGAEGMGGGTKTSAGPPPIPFQEHLEQVKMPAAAADGMGVSPALAYAENREAKGQSPTGFVPRDMGCIAESILFESGGGKVNWQWRLPDSLPTRMESLVFLSNRRTGELYGDAEPFWDHDSWVAAFSADDAAGKLDGIKPEDIVLAMI